MAEEKHKPTLEPFMQHDGFVSWSGTCSCGKWTAAGPTQTTVMFAHSQHRWRSTHPIDPTVHGIFQALQGKEET